MSWLNTLPPHLTFLKLNHAYDIVEHHSRLLSYLDRDTSIVGQSFLQHAVCVEERDLACVFSESENNQLIVIALKRPNSELFYVEMSLEKQANDECHVWLSDVHERYTQAMSLKEDVLYWQGKELATHQRSDEKSDFLAVMSHELRTTLHGLQGMQYLIADMGDLSQEQRSCLSGAQISAKSLKGLVDDLFDISVLECGHEILRSVPFKVYDVLRDAMVPNSALAREKELKFRLILEQVPALVEGDMQRFRQVVMNLVSNAVRFTDSGHVFVRVLVKEKSLLVCVEDTGCGLSDLCMDEFRVGFEPERLSHRAHLGLCVVSRFVHLMGGQVQVRSEVGKGTSVSVLVPVRFLEPNFSSLDQNMLDRYASFPVVSPNKKGGGARQFQGLRVLLAEDDPIGQAVMYQRLRNEGFRYIDKAVCGHTAWVMARSQHYDVIFLDIQMPGMDGFEVAKRIRSLEKNKKRGASMMIALTADALSDMKERCMHAGMDEFVIKPSDADEIIRLLKYRLESI
ncbi:MAG: response regulator [Mariprofundaceae bacterium]|nr:response regulator [Mariprofundaceae bacterium]